MPEHDSILTVDNLTKRYRKLVAVDEISFSIEPGEFVGLIGPNGAGKSTTMGCIAGVLAADGGEIRVAGVDVAKTPIEARKHVGFVPQDLQLYDYLTGEEFLRFVADVRGVSKERADAQITELTELAELAEARNRLVKEYSGGMARKLALCSALLGPPELLLFDEAFVGLDPESTYRFRQRLADFRDDGGAILFSSHILEMIQQMCTRVLIMNDGRIQCDASRGELDALFDGGDFADLNEVYLEATGKA